MNFCYLTTFTYPSSFANRLQVLKMSEAFSGLCDFTLVVGDMAGDAKTIFYENSIHHAFFVRTLGISRGRLRMMRAVRGLLNIIRQCPSGTVFYVREPLPAFILSFVSPQFRNNFFFEAHSFARYPAFIYRRVFRYARGVVVTSEKKATVFQKLFGIPNEHVLVRGNGFDANFFRVMPKKELARSTLGLSPDKPVVTMIGKPTEERDISTFLAAAELMSDVLFLSVGGVLREIERIKSYKGFSCAHFAERARPEEVAAYYAASDVIVVLLSTAFPDIAAYASPLKARESLAAGVPVVFSDVPALRDVADESLVTFVKASDAEALVKGIQSILGDYDAYQKKANQARRIFLDQSWQTRAKDIIQFIKKHD